MKKNSKKKEETGNNNRTSKYSSDVDFNKLIDEALGMHRHNATPTTTTTSSSTTTRKDDNDNDNDNNELAKLNEKIKTATERDIIRLLNEGRFDLISEFSYRMPHLRRWVNSLEDLYWSQKDAINSQ